MQTMLCFSPQSTVMSVITQREKIKLSCHWKYLEPTSVSAHHIKHCVWWMVSTAHEEKSPLVKAGSGSIMLWGCFSAAKPDSLERERVQINAAERRVIPQPNLLLFSGEPWLSSETTRTWSHIYTGEASKQQFLLETFLLFFCGSRLLTTFSQHGTLVWAVLWNLEWSELIICILVYRGEKKQETPVTSSFQ